MSIRAITLACGIALTAMLGNAQAQDPDACQAPDYLTHVEGALPHVAQAIREGRLDLLVVGTGNSTLAGPNGPRLAYPARLQAALARRLDNVNVTLRTDVRSRRTAADMAQVLAGTALEAKPTLVVWQTGTVDAMRGVDPDEFRFTLEKSLKMLLAAGIDVMLVNMQYSPRTESMISIGAYAEAMRWAAQQQDVPLFDRTAIMKHWSDTGAFDLSGSDYTHVAERVHDCLGKLMAETILDVAGVNPSRAQGR